MAAVAAADSAAAAELAAEAARSRTATPAVVPLLERDASLLALPTTHDHIGRVVVPVTINGRGPFRFVVDTGANHSTISPGLARALDLKPTEARSIMLDGVTGSAQVSFVTIDKLQAGELSLGSLELPVVWAPVMGGADGMLGAAGLNERSLMIDFRRNRVVIARSVEAGLRIDATKIHAQRLAPGLMALDIQVGRVPVRAVLDTGSERTLGNLALRDALKAKRRAGGTAYVTSVYGATEQVELGEIARAPPITINTLHITDAAIVYGGFHVFELWGLQDRPALIIGMDVLGTVASLGIDFKNQDVYVLPARTDAQAPQGTAGILGESVMKK